MKFEKTETGFKFTEKNRTIIEHSKHKPLFCVGTGEQRILSKSGFYSVKEKNVKISNLTDFFISTQEKDELCINFSNGNKDLEVIFKINNDNIELFFNTKNSELNRLLMNIPAISQEEIFGCGEQYIGKSLRGKKVPLWVSEPGVGRRADLLTSLVAAKTKHIPRWHNTYYPLPQWVSSSGLWFKSFSFAYTEFNFKNDHLHTAYFWEIPKKVIIGFTETMAKAVSCLSEAEGKQPYLPEWVYDGLWLGTQGGKNRVYNRLKTMEKYGTKISALWCQDWEGRRETAFGKQLKWAWEYDKTLYPELPGFINKLKKEGIRFLGYNNTFLTPGSPMFDEAKEKNYFVQKTDSSPCMVDVPFDPAAMVDFTNPEARQWIKNIIKQNMIEIGMSGWMADFGEMIQHDCKIANGKTGLEYHNQYPLIGPK